MRLTPALCSILMVASFGNVACTGVFYQPDRVVYSSPAEYGGRAGYFPSLDGTRLSYLYYPAAASPRALVLQFHGNGQNMTAHLRTLVWLTGAGYDFMTFDYRGYGSSDGRPTSRGVYEDAISAIRKAQSLAKEASLPLILYGQSLGGSLLLRVMADNPDLVSAQAIVIESAFYSYRSIAAEKVAATWFVRPLQWMVPLLISDRYSPGGSGLENLSPTPVILIYPQDDKIVPPQHGRRLWSELAQPKYLWLPEQGGHLSAMRSQDGKHRRMLLELLEELLAGPPR